MEVTKDVVACDTGKVLILTSSEGQIHQVMFFSDGSGLTEEFIFDKATGVKLNTNMFEYKKPTILDIGPCETILVETLWGMLFTAARVCSHAMATTQLIVCAVANAIGKWLYPPITPDKVLKASGKALAARVKVQQVARIGIAGNIKARGGGDAGISSTTSNAEIARNTDGAQRVPPAQGHLLRWRSLRYTRIAGVAPPCICPCGAWNAAYWTFTTGC